MELPMAKMVRVVILDDHQSIVDGYLYRLKDVPQVEVVGTASFGVDLEPLLAEHLADVLILDVEVPTAPDNANPHPILHVIPKLLQAYPDMVVLVISMHLERALIQAVVEAGASGYILKDDQATIRELGAVILSVARGGIHFSHRAHQLLMKRQDPTERTLTPRQLEALSLCAAYPDLSTAGLASQLGVSNSTARNLLSAAYLRLEVPNRAAAIAKARQLGLITPFTPVVSAPGSPAARGPAR
jgi:DNA-binding NarL/FixJ family response regulator